MKICNGTLIKDSVSVQSDEYGTRAYVNSTRGRAELESECPLEIVQEAYKVWGDAPTVTESTYLPMPQNTEPTLDDRVKALETAQLNAMGV